MFLGGFCIREWWRIAAPNSDWQPRRIGANPPGLPALCNDVFGAVLGACGVPVSLFTDADGTSQRESFRRFLTTGLMPLADLISGELSEKLETKIRFGWHGLYASDMVGRSGAFAKLVAGGVEIQRALSIAGLAN